MATRMRIVAEVPENVFRITEGRLTVNYPLAVVHLAEQRVKTRLLAQIRESSMELEFTFPKCLPQ